MRDFALPAVYAVLVWWATTGAILYLDRRPTRTFPLSMGAATLALTGSLFLVRSSAANPGVSGAYTAFSCGIIVWGWLEMSFLLGFITGPSKARRPAMRSGWRHFLHASSAIIYNELATVAAACVLTAITWQADNRLALWTFVLLWAMRLSAKLNLFLGVPNTGAKFLPPHLQYLAGFFRVRAMNFLFPISITASTVVLASLSHDYVLAGTAGSRTAYALLISLLGLAVLEHWFMVLPFPSESLWRWARRAERVEPTDPVETRDSPQSCATA
jgi:putative photosynthetic complex assembly protein 2